MEQHHNWYKIKTLTLGTTVNCVISSSVGVSITKLSHLKEIKGLVNGNVPLLPVPEGPNVGCSRERKGSERYSNGGHEAVDGAVKWKGHAEDPNDQRDGDAA